MAGCTWRNGGGQGCESFDTSRGQALVLIHSISSPFSACVPSAEPWEAHPPALEQDRGGAARNSGGEVHGGGHPEASLKLSLGH